MSRFRLAPAALAALAAAAAVAGCGGTGATVVLPAQPVGARPSAHPEAGWAAPRRAAGRVDEDFARGAALRSWGYAEGDFGRNRFRVRDGRLEIATPGPSAWAGAHRGFLLFRTVRGDFDARLRVRAAGGARAGLLAGDRARGWVALRAGADGVRRASTTRLSGTASQRVAGAAGWMDLRLVRRGRRFGFSVRPAGGGGRWQPAGAVRRVDLPRALDLGMAVSGGGRAQVDWIRVR
jgi:hypothetical protein